MTAHLTILLAAAGASSRMRGADKVLEPVGGQPLLARLASFAVATKCPVLVALPPNSDARRAALAGLDVAIVVVPRADLGMAESLRVGAARIPPGQGMMVMLADMPEISTHDLAVLIAGHRAHPDAIVRATAADGTPGHPLIFPADLLPAFTTLAGDIGARAILRDHAARVHAVPLPGRRALVDLDTPEDWARWRAAHPES